MGESRPATKSTAPAPTATGPGFPRTVKVRLWYLHPPRDLRVRGDADEATVRKCESCKETRFSSLSLHASGAAVQMDGDKPSTTSLRISGVYQMNAAAEPPIHADFPIELRAGQGRLLI